MNIEQKHELMFIIAKYLKILFPDIAETFIERCESENLFPKPVFSKSATFDELRTSFLSGVPDDQLIRIITHVQNNSKFSSLLATIQQNTYNSHDFIEDNENGGKVDPKFFNGLLCDSLRNQIDPHQTVLQPFYRFAAHHQIISHWDKVFCLATDITSQVLITGSDDFMVKIWKIPEMMPMKTFNVHIDSITDLQVHPNNIYFCSSSHDSTITVFSLQNGGRVVIKLKMKNMVHNIKFSPCGTFLGAASQEGCIKIWNFNEIIEFDKNLQSGEKSKKIKYSIDPIKVINTPGKKPASWLSFSPNSGFVAFSCDPNIIIVSSLTEDYSVQLCGHVESPDFVYFSKNTCKRILSLSCKERCVRLWESQNDIWDKSTMLTNAPKIRYYRATFNCDESRIIGVSSKMINVWDTYSKQQLFVLTHKKYTDHATIVVSHPTNPAVIFVATSKGRTSLWDVMNGQLICGLQIVEGFEILEAIWSPDGQYVFTSDIAGGVIIYMADPENKNKKVTDLAPYTEMFFWNELPEIEKNEAIKENTYSDEHMFNQAYYRKVNSQNFEVETLITDKIGNPLLPQPKRWFIDDVRLKVETENPPKSSLFQDLDEESIALNLMKSLFMTPKNKRSGNNGTNNEESTVVPYFNDEDDNKSKNDNSNAFNDSDGGYETSFDGEDIQRRRKKSREEAEREREERLQRRHRKMEESRNDSGFSSSTESSIASRRVRRNNNQDKKTSRKNLSRSSSSSTTNLLRKRSSRIKLNEISVTDSSQGNSEDQEYEMDPANEYEDENEEYEDEIEFEKEIEDEEEDEEEEEKRHETQRKSKKQQQQQQQQQKKTKRPTRQSSNKRSNNNSNNSSRRRRRNISISNSSSSSRRSRPNVKLSSQSSFVDTNADYDDDDDDTLQSNDYSSSGSDSEVEVIKQAASLSILPSWTFSVKRSIHTYIPQVGDEVVYLQKGHLDWKKECSFMHFPPPYQIRSDLPQVAEARISDIKFYVSHLVITLQFYDHKESNNEASKAKKKGRTASDNYDEIVHRFALLEKKNRKVLFESKIAYPMPDSPQFIVKKSRFVYSMLYTLSLKQADIVKVEFAAPEKTKNSMASKSHQRKNEIDNDVQLFLGKVKNISQNWLNDPWQCINVIFTDDNKPGKLQPWELIFDEEKIKRDLTSSLHDSQAKSDNVENIVENDEKMDHLNDYLVHFVSEMLQKKENGSFVRIRSPDELKILRKRSKFPIDLTLISDRLANRWYTSVESLEYDVKLIKSNTAFLSKLNSKMADRIVEQLMEKVNAFSKPKERTKPINKKSKDEQESDDESETDDSSETDSDTDSESDSNSDDTMADSEPESDSDEPPKSNMRTRRNEKQNTSKRSTPEKPNLAQARNKRGNAQQKSSPKSIIRRESDSSSTESTISSTTSASSSITTTSSDSE